MKTNKAIVATITSIGLFGIWSNGFGAVPNHYVCDNKAYKADKSVQVQYSPSNIAGKESITATVGGDTLGTGRSTPSKQGTVWGTLVQLGTTVVESGFSKSFGIVVPPIQLKNANQSETFKSVLTLTETGSGPAGQSAAVKILNTFYLVDCKAESVMTLN